MRDIPMFATELGVGSLFLKDIPYRGAAYIKIQSSAEPQKFLAECVDFCRAAGAQQVYASGQMCFDQWPHHTDVIQYTRDNFDDFGPALLFPAQEHTLTQWLDIYNKGMEGVPNAAYLNKADGLDLLKSKSAYFVHKDDLLLGIGVVAEGSVKAIVSCQKGAGELVLMALCGALSTQTVSLQVASNNLPAVRLYERMGFMTVGIVDSWYKVL